MTNINSNKREQLSGLPRLASHKVNKTHASYLSYVSLIPNLSRAISSFSKGKVLDIGCGNKPYAELFQNFSTSYIGCDVVQSSDQKVDVICAATEIPLSDSSFETVFSTQTIEHVEDHQGLVKEAFRLLKDDGYFIVSGPMYWHLHEEPYDFFRFTKYGFKYILEKNGFEVLEIIPCGGKWALLGQTLLHTIPKQIAELKLFKYFSNTFFAFLDRKYADYKTTLNYVVIARKPSL